MRVWCDHGVSGGLTCGFWAVFEVFILGWVDGSGGNGVAKHLDAGKVRNRAFDGHEALAQKAWTSMQVVQQPWARSRMPAWSVSAL